MRYQYLPIILSLFLSLLMILPIKAEKSIKTEKNGFTWIKIRDSKTKQAHILSVQGDTIIKNYEGSAMFLADSLYGGYFRFYHYINGKHYEEIYNIWGKKIISKYQQITDCFPDVTEDSIPYFRVKKGKKYGIYDINGNEVIPIKYNDYINISNNIEGFYQWKKHRKPLNIWLPKNIDYRQLREKTANYMRSQNYSQLSIIEEIVDEKDGFNWIRITQGQITGAKDCNGNIIIPLERKYTHLEYMPLKKGLGCFAFNENYHAGICDLLGNVIIPSSRGYSRIKFNDGYGNDGSEILGFFHVYKLEPKSKSGEAVGICDLSGKIIIPTERLYSMIKFWAEKNHIGYFQVCNNEREVKDMKHSVCDLTGEEILPMANTSYFYNEKGGFHRYEASSYSGILLDKNGIADFSLKEQRDNENKIRKQQRSEQIQYMLGNFGQELLRSLALRNMPAQKFVPHHNQSPKHQQNGGSLATMYDNNPHYLNQQLQQLMSLSVMQVQQQEMWEYNQVRQSYIAVGKDLTFDEYTTIKGKAIMDLKNQGIDIQKLDVKEEPNSSKDYKKRSADLLNQTIGSYCMTCHGTGNCPTCKGDKIASSFGNTYICKVCDKTGKCTSCNGTGKASWNR